MRQWNIMIKGVKIKKLKVHQDVHTAGEEVVTKPGVLMEVVRSDENLLKKFGQSIFTIAHHGTIKAFHWHKKQDDLWFVATGKVVIVLYDMRKKSSSYGKVQVIMAGQDDYKVIVIPPGVAHGYKVLSQEPALVFYHTTEYYNPKDPDEGRIPYNDPQVGFDWERY